MAESEKKTRKKQSVSSDFSDMVMRAAVILCVHIEDAGAAGETQSRGGEDAEGDGETEGG